MDYFSCVKFSWILINNYDISSSVELGFDFTIRVRAISSFPCLSYSNGKSFLRSVNIPINRIKHGTAVNKKINFQLLKPK